MENESSIVGTTSTLGGEDTLKLNERLTIVLKEYDALRKEAEQSLALMPEIAKSIGIVIAGALIGLKVSDSLGMGIALCVPPIIMAVLGAVSHAEAKLEATSRRLMQVEDRVFEMAKEPLLTHETRMNARRLGRGGERWFFVSVVGTVLYFAVDIILYCKFHKVFQRDGQSTWVALYWTLVALAGIYAVFAAARIGWQRRHTPRTKLLQHEQERISN